MNRLWTLMRNERGVALPLAMIMLVVLTMLTITFMSLGSVEPQISRNLSDGARARQLAESGLEWAMSTQIGNSDLNSGPSSTPPGTLLGGTMTSDGACGLGFTCRVLASAQTMPGLTSAHGTFGVTLRNDHNTIPGDLALIGTNNTRDSSWTPDINGIVILTSTGRFPATGTNFAQRTITAVIQRGQLFPNAALSLAGVQTDTFTNDPPCGGCYAIDGRNWNITDSSSPTGPGLKFGVATYTGTQPNTGLTYEANAEAGFNTAAKRGYVQGLDAPDGSTDAAGTGRRTIATDISLTSLNPTVVQTFLTNLAANPMTQILNSTQTCQYPSGGSGKPEGLRMDATGTANMVTITNNCTGASQINQTVNLGTVTSPAMVYVKGEFDPASNFIGLAVNGGQPITGYGILVVEDADMSFFQSAQFQWNGIVIVSGRNVGAGFRGGSNTEIRGALIGNETNSSEIGGYFEFLNQSSTMKIRYGQEGIDLARSGLYNTRVSVYREN